MNNFNIDELKELVNAREGLCISIYMPTFDKSQEVRQNPIRFKNLLDRAADEMADDGIRDTLLAPARALLDDPTFWQNQRCGLAVFIGKDFFQTFQLEDSVEEMVLLNDRFYLKPLLPILSKGKHEFLILALSQKEVRLLRATETTVKEVQVPNLPSTMEEVSLDDNEDETTLFHNSYTTPTHAQGGGKQAMFSGHGQGIQEEHERRIERFFRYVDAAVSAHLRDSREPMVLACVEYLAPIYRQASSYQHIAGEILPGNFDGVRPEVLRDEAWKLLSPLYATKTADERERYRMLAGKKDERVVKDIAEIVKAAPFARVETLFVDKNAKKWGAFDEQNLKVRFEDEQGPENQDLLDYAAIQTLINGGTVYILDSEEVPEKGTPIAAIFRY